MSKILVSYFSVSGVTKNKAKEIANILNCKLDEIVPSKLYSEDDLDWRNKNSRSTLEMIDEKSRPEFIKNSVNPEDFDVIFIGFPIWWGVEPRIIDTYLETYNLKGKTIIPFATNAGWLGRTFAEIKSLCPNSTVKDELNIVFTTDYAESKLVTPASSIAAWIDKLRKD